MTADYTHDFYTDFANESYSTYSNRELQIAEKLMKETSCNLFLTGRAGTGKTTFLQKFLKETSKHAVVLAPTGVAAINAGGVTIHSFFQLPFNFFIPGVGYDTDGKGRYNKFSAQKRRLFRSLDLIVIDEISMVRPDILDAIDELLRRIRRSEMPFGGVQLLLIGDLRQLPPVIKEDERPLIEKYYPSPYFFESTALRKAGFYTIELKTIYRQTDLRFISILNAVRDGIISGEQLAELNTRYSSQIASDVNPGFIRLTTHNHTAYSINAANLDNINGKTYNYKCVVKNSFPESAYPAEDILKLKVGAQVMFLKNDPSGEHLYYNGLLGVVKSLAKDRVTVAPLDGGGDISVGMIKWENIRYEHDEATNSIKETVEGTFSQIPLRTAWAITIHKSQGLTFERCIVDASRSFAPGQAYVALSRCRSFEGLMLDSPLSINALICDPHINNFMEYASHHIPDEQTIAALCRSSKVNILAQLFDFRALKVETGAFLRLAHEFLSPLYASAVIKLEEAYNNMNTNLVEVGIKFCNLYASTISHDPDADTSMLPRIKAGCTYFMEKLKPLELALMQLPRNLDNKEKKKRIDKSYDALIESLEIKRRLLSHFEREDFTVNKYSETRSYIFNQIEKNGISLKIRKTKKPVAGNDRISELEDVASDIPNMRLYETLSAWRRELSQSRNLPAYTIISNKCIIEICKALPVTPAEVGKIKGIGNHKRILYGETIADMVKNYIMKETPRS